MRIKGIVIWFQFITQVRIEFVLEILFSLTLASTTQHLHQVEVRCQWFNINVDI